MVRCKPHFLRFLTACMLWAGMATASQAQDSLETNTWVKRNAVKINIFALMNGDLPLSFERRIKKKYSVLGGLGFTSKDLFWELGRNFNDLDLRAFSDPLLGFSIHMGARVYYSERFPALKGAYFEALIRYRYYRSWVSVCNEPTSVTVQFPYLRESRNVSDFLLLFGYQINTRQHFILDFYLGAGLRFREGMTVRCREESGIGLIPGRVHELEYSPKFAVGMKIGFGL
jgi:hypothetical protein